MIDLYGYETSLQQRTFNTYEDVHCFHSAGLHDYMKYIRLGYGKITDHASREIRLKRMTRMEAIKLITGLEQKEPKDLEAFLNWVELTPEVFKKLYWDNRDKSVWEKNKNGEWELKDSIGNYADSDLIKEVSLEKIEECEFILTDKSESDENESEYLLMGRNYINKNNFGSVQNKIDGRSMTKRKWKEKNI